jgi:hypothetical protein
MEQVLKGVYNIRWEKCLWTEITSTYNYSLLVVACSL